MNLSDLIKRFRKTLPNEILGRKVNHDALAYITAGTEAQRNGNFSDAIKLFTKAIELDPNNRFPYSRRGKCFQLIKDYDKALTDLFKSKLLDDNFENNQSIAECYLFKKDFAKAIEFFELAITKLEETERIDFGKMMGIDYGATKARTFNNLAVSHFNLNQIDEAIYVATNGINANPNYSNNYRVRGLSFASIGNISDARNDLRSAARLGDPQANEILEQL